MRKERKEEEREEGRQRREWFEFVRAKVGGRARDGKGVQKFLLAGMRCRQRRIEGPKYIGLLSCIRVQGFT